MKGNISPEMAAWLLRRSAAFAKATQRKGMPMTYGTGKKPEKPKDS